MHSYSYSPQGSKNPGQGAGPGWNEPSSALSIDEVPRDQNLGLLLSYSELLQVDCDDLEKARQHLLALGIDPETEDTLRFRSGRPNSLSLLYKLPDGTQVKTRSLIKDMGLELRSGSEDGKAAYALCPWPSDCGSKTIHPTGSVYTYDNEGTPPKQVPQGLLELAQGARSNAVQLPNPSHSSSEITTEKAGELLRYIDAGCDRQQWMQVLAAIKGSGLSGYDAEMLASEWSQTCAEKFDQGDFDRTWDGTNSHSYSPGTLYKFAQDGGYQHTHSSSQAEVREAQKPSGLALLDSMDCTHLGEEMERQALEEVWVIRGHATLGMANVICAEPGVGKTLMVLSGIIESIEAGRIKGQDVYYINNDDPGGAAAMKLNILGKYGVKCLVPGQAGFEDEMVIPIMNEMAANNQARGKVIILDTLKQYYDLNDSKQGRAWGKVMKAFIGANGTLIMTTHTNKHKDEGKVIYNGTSQLYQDVQMFYVFERVCEENGRHTIQGKKLKGRAMNAEEVINYQYIRKVGTPYEDTLASFQEIQTEQADAAKAQQDLRDMWDEYDEEIGILRECISESDNPTKQTVTKKANKQGLSYGLATKLLEKLDGTEWESERSGNAHLYKLC